MEHSFWVEAWAIAIQFGLSTCCFHGRLQGTSFGGSNHRCWCVVAHQQRNWQGL